MGLIEPLWDQGFSQKISENDIENIQIHSKLQHAVWRVRLHNYGYKNNF